jgi:hypothetical protein
LNGYRSIEGRYGWVNSKKERDQLKEIYKGFEIEMNCKKANDEWQAEIRIIPSARGVDSIVPIFGYTSENNCRSAALELAKEHIDRITTLKDDYRDRN